ncbi:AMP-binding protein [Streptomyces sp. SJ1-7]|nr:AMP-binding protein [Streptomyces sp. SJ1-7]
MCAAAPRTWRHGSRSTGSPTCSPQRGDRAGLPRRPGAGPHPARLVQVAQAGEALVLSDAVRQFFRLRPGRRLHNHYGPTETHAVTSWAAPPTWRPGRHRPPVGLPVWNTSLYVLDEALRLVPPGWRGSCTSPGSASPGGTRAART